MILILFYFVLFFWGKVEMVWGYTGLVILLILVLILFLVLFYLFYFILFYFILFFSESWDGLSVYSVNSPFDSCPNFDSCPILFYIFEILVYFIFFAIYLIIYLFLGKVEMVWLFYFILLFSGSWDSLSVYSVDSLFILVLILILVLLSNLI